MTLQPKLSKRLAITWITDKPYKDRCRESPDFCLGEATWYLKMMSDVIFAGYKKPYYDISLIERGSTNPRIPFIVETGVDTNRENSNPFLKPCSSVTVKSHKQNIWSREMDSITSSIDSFHSYAELMVVCVFKGIAPSTCRINSETIDLSTQTDIGWPLTNFLLPELLPPDESSKDVTCEFESLSGDYSNLLDQQHFADLKLTCKGRSFSVHRSILAARSEYFAKKLEVKSVGNVSPTVDISDVDDHILELLLKFVYSGKILCLNEESAPKLCAAGRMFAVHGLQKACSQWMVRNLSQENCVTFLAISGEVDDDAFKSAVASFIVRHPDVLKTESWRTFSKVDLKLANEVYESLFSRVFDKSDLAD